MKFTPLFENGPVLIEMEKRVDERGFFARSFCEDELKTAGIQTHWPQQNVSFNVKKGTVRGMHFQNEPFEEPKIVRCTRGAIHDVVIDLRASSPQHGASFAVELSADNHNALFIPGGFAHGFQTLDDNTEVLYHMGALYQPDAANGLRWNDPTFNIVWPLPINVISERDAAYPLYDRTKPFFA